MWLPELKHSDDAAWLAIVEALERDIDAGALRIGERLPTQRELALRLRLSLGTVTRAYAEASRRRLIRGEVGRGSFIADARIHHTTLEPASPGLIDLGPTWPVYEKDPDLRESLRELARRPGLQRLLRYQPHAGMQTHRDAGAAWMGRLGVDVSAERIAVTAGVQHAIVCALSTIAEPGDVVLSESLTYPGFKAAAKLLRMRVQGVEIDEEGILPAALDAACARRKARVLYLVPTLHNPTTAIMTPTRRREVAEIARRRNLTIIEDDVHRPLLRVAPATIASHAPERTYYIAGLSKSITGALRIAFLVTPDSARERMADTLWATQWMASPITAEIAAMWIEDGTAEAIVEAKRAESEARQAMARKALAGADFDTHRCAPHLWLRLPEQWSGPAFVRALLAEGVVVTPAEAFAVLESKVPAAVRLSLSAAEDRAQLDEALERIARLLAQRPNLRQATI